MELAACGVEVGDVEAGDFAPAEARGHFGDDEQGGVGVDVVDGCEVEGDFRAVEHGSPTDRYGRQAEAGAGGRGEYWGFAVFALMEGCLEDGFDCSPVHLRYCGGRQCARVPLENTVSGSELGFCCAISAAAVTIAGCRCR